MFFAINIPLWSLEAGDIHNYNANNFALSMTIITTSLTKQESIAMGP